jgi:intraflagellar transport protein 56
LCQYKEAKDECKKAEDADVDESLLNRLHLHLGHKMLDEENIMACHSKLTNSVEDQLCLAALHYLRNHYEDATEIYKNLLLEK